jgi:hypothetical protein
MSNFFLILILSLLFFPAVLPAEEKPDTKKATTQNVGGLLFDVDEGVKVEQGPGGSVYVKSNREYMQQKFEEIDQRLSSLEERLARLELKETAKNSAGEDGRKVLIT